MADPKVGMSNYTPQPEYKFTFGVWTVGKIGRDPFDEPTCSRPLRVRTRNLSYENFDQFMIELFLGLNSSTVTKVVTIDETRSMAASVAHRCETPRPQWSEQHPDLLRHDLVAGWTV